MRKPRPFRALLILGAFGVLLGGCYVPDRRRDEPEYVARSRWFVHCDECAWCRGPYKRADEAQSIVSEHNIARHDYFRIAYYDTVKCSR